jgi:hypothetical protein
MIIIDPMKVQPSTATHQKEWQELAVNQKEMAVRRHKRLEKVSSTDLYKQTLS